MILSESYIEPRFNTNPSGGKNLEISGLKPYSSGHYIASSPVRACLNGTLLPPAYLLLPTPTPTPYGECRILRHCRTCHFNRFSGY